ncbi:MAG TPA: hypothetical protein VHS09_15710 [Polyangiaceae bacterium]|nr:hypothetical protein [Polyangiaceae bacterium]
MRRVALLFAAIAAVGVVAGCELLVGIEDKTQASDASVADGAGVTDGGGDATDGAVVADPDVPCDQQPTNLFCDDFDSEPEAGDGWLWDIVMGGGTVDLSTAQPESPPRSALFMIPGAPASAQLGQNVGTDLQTGYRLAFDLRVDLDAASFANIPQVAPAQLYRTSGSSDQLTVAYVLGPGAQAYVQVFEGSAGSPTNVTLSRPPPPQAWTRIVLVYDAQQGLTILEDGASIGASAAAAHGAPGLTSIIVGAVYSNGAGGATTLEVDNVVLRGE